jgi:hypothetical protein
LGTVKEEVMFSHEGLRFQGMGDGSVVIGVCEHRTENSSVVRSVVFSAEDWAKVVAEGQPFASPVTSEEEVSPEEDDSKVPPAGSEELDTPEDAPEVPEGDSDADPVSSGGDSVSESTGSTSSDAPEATDSLFTIPEPEEDEEPAPPPAPARHTGAQKKGAKTKAGKKAKS